MKKPWTECYAEVHRLTIREKQVKVTITVSTPADLDVSSEETEQIIRDLIASNNYTMVPMR